MRIALTLNATSRGGVWRHVSDLGAALARSGHDIVIGLPPGAAELRDHASDLGLRCVAQHDALRLPVDVWHLHLHDTYDRRALPQLLTRKRAGGAVVVTEHLPRSNASDPRLLPGPRTPGAYAAKSILKQLQQRLVDRTIVVSRSSREFLRIRYGTPASSVRVVENGVPPAAPAPAPAPLAGDSSFQVIAVGSLAVQKGFDVLIEAAVRSGCRWNLTIVGEGSARASLEERAGALPPGRVTLAGWRDDAANAALGAHVLCMPSRWEAFPYAPLEAMAIGRAVVATSVDGLAEIVVHGQTGLLVPPEDPIALAEALDALAGDPHRAAVMGEAGRERVARRFTLDRMVAGTLAVYEEAARGG